MNQDKKAKNQTPGPSYAFTHTKTVHMAEPDYSQPPPGLSPDVRDRVLQRMAFIYGLDMAETYMPELERIIRIYTAHKPPGMSEREKHIDPENRFTEKDVILITYGDLLHGSEHSPLATLARFCDTYLGGAINTLHILPFFPYSSDRGFSITDFESVDPNLGSWSDIEDLEGRYQLMFDGVINHVSSKSRWFQEFLNGSPYYRDFFITYKSSDELLTEHRAVIFRPRTTDILNRFDTIDGPRYVWCTFSRDQVDLNYRNPNTLVRVVDILLTYVRRGADIIRLDAVTYLWSEPGTSCIHLDQTHEIVRIFRDILDSVAPWVALITETNVPHEENISYFGNGRDEAHMVYNFALPPLVLHTFYRGDSTMLTEWASGLAKPSPCAHFFNFLDSHDGVGLMAVRNILPADDIAYIIKRAEENGGLISYKTGPEGNEEPYEINITWYSALNSDNGDEDTAFQVRRFVASRVIPLVLQGVPAIYLHGLIGTQNDIEAVLRTDSKRDINRTVIDETSLTRSLEDPLSKISRINRELGRIIAIRVNKRAFHPCGAQHVLSISPRIFSVFRISPDGDSFILCLVNITDSTCSIDVPVGDLPVRETRWFDLISGMEYLADSGALSLSLEPYEVMWLEKLRES